jgi:citrate lyase subunit beta/citryl-CoA lyase
LPPRSVWSRRGNAQGPKQTIIAPPAPASCDRLPGTVADFDDLEAFRATIHRSRRFGVVGASCIHPSQVPILNEEFGWSDAEIDRARRMVAAYDAAMAQGLGAVTFEGKMIDVPVVERAEA